MQHLLNRATLMAVDSSCRMTKLFAYPRGLGSSIRSLVLPFLLIMASGIAPSQAPSGSQNPSGENYRIRINTDLVVLHAAAQNRKGVLVSGLDKESFQISEDGA